MMPPNALMDMGSGKDSLDMEWMGTKGGSTLGGYGMKQNGLYQSSGVLLQNAQNEFSGQYDGSQFGTGQFGPHQLSSNDMHFDSSRFSQFNNSSAHHTWQTHGLYLQKVILLYI